MQLDLTRPNNGRVIDYWLGGSHNFEIDRRLGDEATKKFPLLSQLVRESRALVRRGVEYFYARGIRALLDFGAALPTCENTHLVAHKLDSNIKVVYSDIDPITVAYGQELLQGKANVIYLQCDAAEPRTVLDAPETKALLGDERRVGIVFLSLAHLFSDAQLRNSWKTLYDWAASDSYMIASATNELWDSEPDLIAVRDAYRRAGTAGYNRSLAQLMEAISPWQVTEEGVADDANWGLPQAIPPQRRIGFSMMLRKP
jgi:hypothetical protein